LSKLEGIIPAIESSHALAVLDYLNAQENETVVIGLSGRGDKDLSTYMKHL
jgi:tryptophan synthase beta chain